MSTFVVIAVVVALVVGGALLITHSFKGYEPDGSDAFADAFDGLFGLRRYIRYKRPDLNPWADKKLEDAINAVLDIEATAQNKPVETPKDNG